MKKIVCSILLFLVCAANAQSNVIGPRLKFIQKNRQSGRNRLFKTISEGIVPVTMKFRIEIDINALIHELPDGIDIYTISGTPLYSKHVLVAQIDPATLDMDDIQRIPDLVEIESLWRPQRILPLDVSRPQMQTGEVWNFNGTDTLSLTGKGILITDLDSGINLFHPAFFFANGDTFSWIDANANNSFDPGIDGVDKNVNGHVDPDEYLNFIQIVTHLDNPSAYNPSIDWLYNDLNGNLERDFGPEDGFTENDLTYGEQLYIVSDTNGNDLLDISEKLIALGSSKIRKVFQTDGSIISRGVDLISNEGDFYNHGTPVAGILAGGIPGVHKLAGIAPGAELLMGNNFYIEDPPFIYTMEILAPWAVSEGTDIILYEDGEWIWQYMDGSSALEIMINDYASEGIGQVVPAGNLAGGGMHTSGNALSGEEINAALTVLSPSNQRKIWGSFLWLGDSSAFAFRLTDPENSTIDLMLQAEYQPLGDDQIYSNMSRSTRGTNRMDFLILAESGSLTGSYAFTLRNNSSEAVSYHAYLWDDRSSWSGRTRWDQANDDGTVTWPATADSAVTVAAYSPRDPEQMLNSFSGRGRRIDGVQIVDISAPGSTVYSTTRSMTSSYGGYRAFGGTSSAGPHVAGAVALMLQHDPSMSHGDIRRALHQSADTENIFAGLPDDMWGYGRIRILDAINAGISPVMPPITTLKPEEFSISAAPNPFNSTLKLYYSITTPNKAKVTVYNIIGQSVITLSEKYMEQGHYTVLWNGSDRYGNPQVSGVYFAVLESGNHRSVRKIALIK